MPKMAKKQPIVAHDPQPIQQYSVYEHDLRTLASGSSEGQIYLNFTCALIPLGITGIVGLASTESSHVKLCLFHSVLTVFGIGAGIIFGIMWRRAVKDKQSLLDAILSAPISSGPIGEDGHEIPPAAAGTPPTPGPNVKS